jgi:radical SAM protein with 4Fe4S-binding SPASM domain
MNFKELKKCNIYTVPVGKYFGKENKACYLVYSPLANVFFLSLPDEVASLEQLLEDGKSSNTLSRLLEQKQGDKPGETYDTACTLHLLLNEKCNFHCKYCYSAEGRSTAELSMETIRTALSWFLSSKRKAPKDRTVMFMGGGEPVLSWEKLEQSTALAKQISAQNDVSVHFSLTTNGSIMNGEMLDFLKTNHFTVQISFEVLPDIQNEQRGMNDAVSSNLKRLTEAGISNFVRSTITAANVDRIREMVEYCQTNFPLVKKLSCQNVVDPEYFTSVEAVSDFFSRYSKAFAEAGEQAKKTGLELRSSTSHLAKYSMREKFCYDIVCLTPYGTLTTCPDISSPKEEAYAQAVFAEIENEEIVFDDAAFKRLTKDSIHTVEKCRTCWARWNCGSGCRNSRRVYSAEIFDRICDFYRSMLCEGLMSDLAGKYQTATGKDFYKDITGKL